MQEQRTSIPSWNDTFSPQRCEVCGRMLMPAGLDWGKTGIDQLAKDWPANPWLDSWNRTWSSMYDTWMQAVNTSWAQVANTNWAPFLPQQQRRQGKHMERCRDCERHDCDCRCCVGEADLLVYARVGERRIVPLVIENDSHREKQVELELSDWSTHSGKGEIQVSGQLLSPLVFTLAACSEQKVTLMVQVMGKGMDDTANAALGDVGGCQVYYADLRVKGCDVRPVRIALALLSRECAALTIECRCNCC